VAPLRSSCERADGTRLEIYDHALGLCVVGPGDEALDASNIAAVIVDCIRAIAGPNEIPVHSINPTVIAHVDLADGRLIQQKLHGRVQKILAIHCNALSAQLPIDHDCRNESLNAANNEDRPTEWLVGERDFRFSCTIMKYTN
jgi:hypothetical protein